MLMLVLCSSSALGLLGFISIHILNAFFFLISHYSFFLFLLSAKLVLPEQHRAALLQ